MTSVRALLLLALTLPLLVAAGYVHEQPIDPWVRWIAYGYMALVWASWVRMIRRL